MTTILKFGAASMRSMFVARTAKLAVGGFGTGFWAHFDTQGIANRAATD